MGKILCRLLAKLGFYTKGDVVGMVEEAVQERKWQIESDIAMEYKALEHHRKLIEADMDALKEYAWKVGAVVYEHELH